MDDTELEEEFDRTPARPQKLIKESRINVEKVANKEMLNLDRAQKTLVDVYRNEKRIPVRVAPAYAKHFGRVMRVSINGISIAVKCDGNTVELPESFAAEVYRRMSEMDKLDLKRSSMANVEKNFETSPGQLNFFG